MRGLAHAPRCPRKPDPPDRVAGLLLRGGYLLGRPGQLRQDARQRDAFRTVLHFDFDRPSSSPSSSSLIHVIPHLS